MSLPRKSRLDFKPQSKSLASRSPPNRASPLSRRSSPKLDRKRYDSDGEQRRNDERLPSVRYITHDMLRRRSGQENLAMVTGINLNLEHPDNKKIKYIENLEVLRSIRSLNLSHNVIERIERLYMLTTLTELNLAHNRITQVSGLDQLTSLVLLDLTANQIVRIPPATAMRKLHSLRELRLAENQLSTLRDVNRLKVCSDLSRLTLAGNPLTEMAHWWLFAVYHLRSLESLDGKEITTEEQRQAKDRFSMDEVSYLEAELAKQDEYIALLEEDAAVAVQRDTEHRRQLDTLRVKEKDREQRIDQLQRDLEVKEGLLKLKSEELARSARKHFELEQELAFSKLDRKFDPQTWVRPTGEDSDDEFLESPYLGKARFKPSSFTHEHVVPSPVRKALFYDVRSPPENGEKLTPRLAQPQRAVIMNGVNDEMEATLQQRTNDLQEVINVAQQLGEQLQATQQQLAQAQHQLRDSEHRNGKIPSAAVVQQLQEELTALQEQMARLQAACANAEGQLVESERRSAQQAADLLQAQRNLQDAEERVLRAAQAEEQVAQLREHLNAARSEADKAKERAAHLDAALELHEAGTGEEINQLQEQLANLLASQNESEEQRQRLATEQDVLLQQVEDLQNQLADVRQAMSSSGQEHLEQLGNAHQQLLASAEEARQLRNECTALQDELADQKASVHDLENQLAQARAALHNLPPDDGLLEKVAALEDALRKKDGELAGLQEDLGQAQQALHNLQEQLRQEQGTFGSERATWQQARKQLNNQLAGLQHRYQQELNNLQEQLQAEQAAREHDAAQHAALRLKTTPQQDDSLLARLSELVAALEHSTGSTAHPSAEDEPGDSPRARRMADAIVQFVQQNAGQAAQLSGEPPADGSTIQLGQRLARLLIALAEEAEIAQQQLMKCMAENNSLRKRQDELLRHQPAVDKTQQADDLQTAEDIAQLRAELNNLQESIAAQEGRAKVQLAAAKADNNRLEDALEEAKRRAETAEKALEEELAAQQAYLKERGQLNSSRLEKVGADLSATQKSLAGEREVCQQLQADVEQLAAERGRLQQDIADLQASLRAANKECDELRAAAQLQEQKLDEAQRALHNELSAQQAYLKEHGQQTREKLEQADAEAATARSQLAAQEAVEQQLRQQLEEVVSERDILLRAVQQLEDQLRQLRHDILAKNRQLEQLRQDVHEHSLRDPSAQDLSELARAVEEQQRLVARLQHYLPQTNLSSYTPEGNDEPDSGNQLSQVLEEVANLRAALLQHQELLRRLRTPRNMPSHRRPRSRGHGSGQLQHDRSVSDEFPGSAPSAHLAGLRVASRSTSVDSIESLPGDLGEPDTVEYPQPEPSTVLRGSESRYGCEQQRGGRRQSRGDAGHDQETFTDSIDSSSQPTQTPLTAAPVTITPGAPWTMQTALRGSFPPGGRGSPVRLSLHTPRSSGSTSLPPTTSAGGRQLYDVSYELHSNSDDPHSGYHSRRVGGREYPSTSTPHTPRSHKSQFHHHSGLFCNVPEHSWLESRVSELETSLSMSRHALRDAEKQLFETEPEARGSVAFLESQLQCKQREVDELDEQIDQEHQELDSTKRLTAQAKKRLDGLQSWTSAAEQRLSQLQHEMEELEARQESVRRQRDHLQQDIDAASAKRQQLLQEQDTLSKRVMAKQDRLVSLSKDIHDLEEQASRVQGDLAGKQHNLTQVELEFQHRQDQLVAVRQTLASSQRQLHDEEQETTSKQAELARLQHSLDGKQAELDLLDRQLLDVKASVEDQQHRTTSLRLGELNHEVSSLEERIRNMQQQAQEEESAALHQRELLFSEKERLDQMCHELRSELARSQEELASLKQKRLEEEGHAAATRQQIVNVQDEAQQLQRRINQMQQENMVADGEKAERQGELLSLQQQLHLLQEQLLEHQQQRASHEDHLAALRRETIEQEAAVKAACQHYTTLTQQTDLARKTLAKVEEQCGKAKEKLAAVQDRLSQELQQLKATRQQQWDAQQLQRDLHEQCLNLKRMAKGLQEDRNEFELETVRQQGDMIVQLKEQLRRVTRLNEQRDVEFAAIQQQLSTQRQEKKTLKRRLKAEESRKESLREELSSQQQFMDESFRQMRGDITSIRSELQDTPSTPSHTDRNARTPSRSHVQLSDTSSSSSVPDDDFNIHSLSRLASHRESQLDAQLSRHEDALRAEQSKAQGCIGSLHSQMDTLEQVFKQQKSISAVLENTPTRTASQPTPSAMLSSHLSSPGLDSLPAMTSAHQTTSFSSLLYAPVLTSTASSLPTSSISLSPQHRQLSVDVTASGHSTPAHLQGFPRAALHRTPPVLDTAGRSTHTPLRSLSPSIRSGALLSLTPSSERTSAVGSRPLSVPPLTLTPQTVSSVTTSAFKLSVSQPPRTTHS